MADRSSLRWMRGRPGPDEGLRGSMVGRDPELSGAVSILSSALASGHPALVGYWGPAGIGKTRLVRGIESSMPEAGFAVIEAGTRPGGRPFSDFVCSWFGTLSSDRSAAGDVERFDHLLEALETRILSDRGPTSPLLRELARTRPWLEELAGVAGPASAVPTEPSLRTGGLADATVAFMSSLATVEPLVVVMENMHLFSGTDLAVAERLIDASGGLPMSFLATSRPAADGSEPEFPSTSALDERIVSRLEGLPKENLPELVEGLTGKRPGVELVDLLWDRAGGAPLLLEHTLDYLAETGALQAADGLLGPGEHPPGLPGTVRGILAARIALMSPELVAVLKAGAVLGGRTTTRKLSMMTSAEDIPGLVALGVERNILTPGEGSFVFSHELLRQAVLDSIPGEELAGLHLAAAGTLQTCGCHSAAELEEIGDHLLLGGETEEAILNLERAAAEYADSYENEAALQVRRRMIPLLGGGAGAENVLALAKAQAELGLMNESIDLLVRTLDSAMSGEWIEGSLGARLTMRLGMCLGSTGRLVEARSMLTEAVGVFRELDDRLNLCVCLRHLGMAELSAGDTGDAIGHLEESVRLARIVALPTEICSSLYWSAIAYRQTGDLDRMRSSTEEQVALAEESGLLKSRISGYDNLMRLHIYTTDYESAARVHGLLVETAEKCGNRAALSAAASKMGIIHLRREEWAAAAECFRRCVTLTGRTGNLRARCAALGNLAHVCLGMEDTDSAMEYSMRLIDTASAIGFRSGLMSGYARMAYILGRKGAWESALDCLDTQMEHAGIMGDSRNLSDGHATRARMLLSLDRPEGALLSVNLAIEASEDCGAVRLLAGQLELRGRLLYMLGRSEEAIIDLLRSLEMTEGKVGREKVAFRSKLYLEASKAASGDSSAPERVLSMLGEAPDEPCGTELLYEHWNLTGSGDSAAGARAGLESMLEIREEPLARRMLVALDTVPERSPGDY